MFCPVVRDSKSLPCLVAGFKTPLKTLVYERVSEALSLAKEGDRDFTFGDFVQSLADGDLEAMNRPERIQNQP